MKAKGENGMKKKSFKSNVKDMKKKAWKVYGKLLKEGRKRKKGEEIWEANECFI